MQRARTTRTTIAGFVLVVGAALSVADAADTVAAVTTPGSGSLTICRNWLVTNSCTTYTRVALPQSVFIGDKLSLTYGSNPKDYTFPVRSIRYQDGTASCTILSDESATADGEKIEVARCERMTYPAANP